MLVPDPSLPFFVPLLLQSSEPYDPATYNEPGSPRLVPATFRSLQLPRIPETKVSGYAAVHSRFSNQR
jgi:hypothetical protein